MSQTLWIIDPDPTSAQAMRSALDLLGPEVETFDQIPERTELPHAVLIAGAVGADQVEDWIGQLRRTSGADLLPITVVGGIESSAEALALGADHFLASPVKISVLVEHLNRFLSLDRSEQADAELVESRGHPERKQRNAPDEEEQEVAAEDEPVDEQEAATEDELVDEQEAVAEDEPVDEQEVAAEDEPVDEQEVAAEDEAVDEQEAVAEDEAVDEQEAVAEDEAVDEQELVTEDEAVDEQELVTEDEPIGERGATVEADQANAQDLASENEQEITPAPSDGNFDDSEAPISEQLPSAEDPNTEDLFGLKQPEEIKELSLESENTSEDVLEPAEPANEPATDLGADSRWGLEDAPQSEEPATAGWDTPKGGDDWGASEGASGGDSGWSDQSDDSSWGDDGSSGWGEQEGSWGDEGGGWGGAQAQSSQPKANLQSLGEQLVAPTPKPRAPVGSITNLGAAGVLGLLGRCGKERVSGRINIRNTHESLALYFEDGRLVALNSASFDDDLLQGALAQGWIDSKELAAIRHLQQRRHSSAAAVLVREGVRDGDDIQKLAQETAERCLLRSANLAGGEAEFLSEMDTKDAIALGRVDTVTRIIALAESLVDSALWTALVGGDDAIPELRLSPLPQDLPGREALHQSNGQRSLLELATASGVSVAALRIGCLAALALGHIELQRLGLASIQRSHRPDHAFKRAVAQIRSGDYFAVLGLADAHSETEVRRAFAARVTLLRLHLSADHPRFSELYNELEEAREVLLDPDLRAQYRTANPKAAERAWPCETS